MSTTVDNRVVSMQFDNRHFERNVQTSVGTLEKLKQSLNLSGAAKGLSDINSAANGVNLSPLGRGVETVQAKFSALQVMAVTALANITNSAVNAGKKIASALTIEPIKTGFQEYETQIGAVQTILANTESKGSTLDDVNNALDELNTYADKTIYNFTQMTRNIGTFTAAGVDLEKSVTSIKGIANLAAVSGSTSQQASTAMYQLSQALAAGKVSLMDWNSVVNAGMGGQVFQDALKRTAKQMGHDVDGMIKKYGSFRESLTRGQWLTAEVLTETLTQLSGAYSEADLIAQGYSKKQAQEIVKLADTAVNAATKVKTFTQLVDTLKEAAQSGWTQTWELIVGDFEEAKLLFTEISDKLGGIINESAKSRNDLVKGALSSNWDRLIEKMDKAGIESKAFEDQIKKTAKAHKIDVDALVKKHGTLGQAIKEGAISTDILKKSVSDLSKKLPDLDAITKKLDIGSKGKGVKELQKALKNLKFDVGKTGADGVFGKKTQEAVKAFQKANKLKVTGIVDKKTLDALNKATVSSKELNKSVKGLINNVDQLGGRDLLIDSLRNAFKAVESVVTPIKEAFRDIFPAPSAKQILDAIKSFHKFTEKLILNEKQQQKLKTTFKGVFSIIDIGVSVIKDIVGGIVTLIGKFSGLGDNALDVTNKFGKWATGLRKSVKESDLFGKTIDKIVGVLGKVIDKFKIFASAVKEKFVTPGFSGFVKVLNGLWNIIQKVAGKIAQFGGAIGKALGEAFNSGDMLAGLDVLNAALGAGLILNLKNFISNVSKQLGSGVGIIDSIRDTFGALQDSLSSLQDNLKAKTLKEIATAIAILAASLLVLSLIDPAKLAASLGAVTGLFIDLMGALAITGRIEGSFASIVKATTAMKGMAVAILILAFALKTVSDIEPERLAGGISGIIVLTAIMVKAAEALTKMKVKKLRKSAMSFIGFAIAIKILASAVKDLSSLNFSELATGLFGVGALMAAVAIFINKTDMKGKSKLPKIATGILILGAAMKVFASAVKDFAKMNVEQLAKGLGSVGIMLFALSKFTGSMGEAKNMISTGAGLVLIGAAMKVLASAINDLGGMDPQALGLGLAGMVVALYAIAGIMSKMPKNMMATSIALVIVAAAISSLAKTLNSLGGMKWDEIGRGLTALGGSLFILAIGLGLMSKSLAGAAALIIAAGALAILAPALALLGHLSWEQIGRGLTAVAGAIAIFAIAAAVLTATGLIGAMFALAGAIALFGVGCLAAGAGITLIATGLTLLATSLSTGATIIVAGLAAIITGLLALIPAIIARIGEAIVLICQVLIKAVPVLCQTITVIVTAVLLALNTIVPLAVDVILNLLTKLIEAIDNYLPRILEAALNIVLTILKGIRDHIGEIVLVALEIVTNFINGIAAGLPGVIDAAFNLIISFIEGLADAIDKNTDRLINAVIKLFLALLRAAVKILTLGIVDIKDVGKKIMDSGFIKGVKDKFSNAVKTIKELPGKLKKGLLDKLSDLKNAGKDLMNGFINGIKDKMKAAGDAAKSVGKKALGSIKNVLGIKSPSREFAKVGRFADLGLAKGLINFAGKVKNAAINVGTTALDTMKGALSRVSDLVSTDIDSQPTIRPVLDLSDVEAGAGAINGMFGTPSVGVMSNLGAISSMMRTNQNGGNDDVVSAIKDLRDSIGNMSGNTYNVNGVTYDDGSNIANAVQALTRAATIERRI